MGLASFNRARRIKAGAAGMAAEQGHDEPFDINKLTAKELAINLDAKGIEYPKGAKKDVLFKLLEDALLAEAEGSGDQEDDQGSSEGDQEGGQDDDSSTE